MGAGKRSRVEDEEISLISTTRRIESALTPLVALLATADERAATAFSDVFEDAAADWRLVRVSDGAAAARHIMQKGLPEMLITAAVLPKVSGPELVEWLRSFRCARPIPAIVYDSSVDPFSREHFLQKDVTLFLDAPCPRRELFGHISRIVGQVESRRFALV